MSRTKQEPVPIWRSWSGKGYWTPNHGEIKISQSYTLVHCGDAVLTRKARPHAKYVLLEKSEFGNKAVGYFVTNKRFEKIKEECAARPSVWERRCERFARKYHTDLHAIASACEALFSLNRYAKHDSCSRTHRDQIYCLKNKFIKLLYDRGLSSAVWLHKVWREVKHCRRCAGTGEDWSGDECHKCMGSGIFKEAHYDYFYCFRFVLAGKTYTWHQPEYLLDYELQATETPSDWDGSMKVKPLKMPRSKLAEAKDLLRWILQRAAEHSTEQIGPVQD